ncbi:MAG: Uma2 family endonuclease [Anaerolineae bacterium]|nr:Uma2 family endonuclease [Anaerolineae bacterium]NUQ04613.1 Uma2 family endonuclease [Anaerolineae bacterium]
MGWSATRRSRQYDRTGKFWRYQTLDSLQEYVLIAQDQPVIEIFRRQPDAGWLYHRAEGLDAALRLESIDCRLSLAEVYRRVNFDPPESAAQL